MNCSFDSQHIDVFEYFDFRHMYIQYCLKEGLSKLWSTRELIFHAEYHGNYDHLKPHFKLFILSSSRV